MRLKPRRLRISAVNRSACSQFPHHRYQKCSILHELTHRWEVISRIAGAGRIHHAVCSGHRAHDVKTSKSYCISRRMAWCGCWPGSAGLALNCPTSAFRSGMLLEAAAPHAPVACLRRRPLQRAAPPACVFYAPGFRPSSSTLPPPTKSLRHRTCPSGRIVVQYSERSRTWRCTQRNVPSTASLQNAPSARFRPHP